MNLFFSHIIGNDRVKQYLARMVEKNAIPHAMLFVGPSGVGKKLFAQAFAKTLLCANDPDGIHERKIQNGNHPDLRLFSPEGKLGLHSIDRMRHFIDTIFELPYESPFKVLIIDEADRMLPYSANALLKTLEEPPKQTVIILISSHSEAILPTILSRCSMTRFRTVEDQLIEQWLQNQQGKNSDEAKSLAALAGGSFGKAICLAKGEENAIRHRMTQLLAKGKMQTYTELLEVTKEISERVEHSLEDTQELARQALIKLYPENPTSFQQQAIEKEMEGITSLHLLKEADTIFESILSWYRDMTLLHLQGNPAYLHHPHAAPLIDQSLQRGRLIPLSQVQEAISQAKLALQRSTSLKSCLETLFLKIGLI